MKNTIHDIVDRINKIQTNQTDFDDYGICVKDAVKRLFKTPTVEIKQGRAVKGIILFDHYKIDLADHNQLFFSINYKKSPSDYKDFCSYELDQLICSADTVVEGQHCRKPNQKWVMDVVLFSDQADRYSSFGFFAKELNYVALAFYIKTCAYVGALWLLDHEVLYWLAFLLTAKKEMHNRVIQDNVSDPSKRLLLEKLITLSLSFYSKDPTDQLLNDFLLLNSARESNDRQITHDLNQRLLSHGEKITKSLKKMVVEKEVLSYLDTLLGGTHITQYAIAVKNISKHQSSYKLCKQESPNLINYTFIFEPNLNRLKSSYGFNEDNLITNWWDFAENFTFPETIAFENFKQIPITYLYTQQLLANHLNAKPNQELLKGICLTQPQYKNSTLHLTSNFKFKNRWIFLMNWLTHGKEWANLTCSQFLDYTHVVSNDTFPNNIAINHLYKNENFDYLGVNFAVLMDAYVKYIQHNKVLAKENHKRDKKLFEQGEITRNERASRNEYWRLVNFNFYYEMKSFLYGYHEENGIKSTNLRLIKEDMSFLEVCSVVHEWNKLNKYIQELPITNPILEDFPHIKNGVQFKFDNLVIDLISTSNQLLQMNYISRIEREVECERVIAMKCFNNDKLALNLLLTLKMTRDQNNHLLPKFNLGWVTEIEKGFWDEKVEDHIKELVHRINENPSSVLNLNKLMFAESNIGYASHISIF